MAVVFGVLGVVVGAVAWQQNVAIGLFVLAVFGGSAVVMAVFALRMRDEEPGVGGTAPDADLRPVTAASVAESDRPQPWTEQQVAAELARVFADTPYEVAAAPGRIRVSADLADARFMAGPGARRVRTVFTSEVLPKPGGRAAVLDGLVELDWTAGLDGELRPQLSGRAKVSGGRVHVFTRRIEFGLGPDGLTKQVDYAFNSGDVHGPINAVLDAAGWRRQLSAEAKGALIMAAIGFGGALVAGVALALRALLS